MTERVYNFSAGPATLPVSVLQEVQRDLLALPDVGISVLEISHRSSTFDEIRDEAEENLRRLLGIPEDYHVLFLQGGATLQFSMVPMTFLRGASSSAQYLVTGSWSKKAVAEAQKEGPVEVVWDGGDDGYRRVPDVDEVRINPESPYVHFTSNETIQGVEFHGEPASGDVPLICDASSDFLSRPLPVERYALIYAGAQKNSGPAGVTVVVLRDDLLLRVPEGLPSILD